MVDGYGGDFKKLFDQDLIERYLNELPEKLGMEKMIAPIVLPAPAVSEKDKGGVTGFVVINTSHISCHTFPHRGFVSIDIYTCQDQIDKDFVVEYFTNVFDLKDVEVNYLQRGTRFPEEDIY